MLFAVLLFGHLAFFTEERERSRERDTERDLMLLMTPEIYNCCLTPSQPQRSYQGDWHQRDSCRQSVLVSFCWDLYSDDCFYYFLLHFIISFGKFGPTWVRLQQPQEQHYPALQVHAGSVHVSIIHQTLTWTAGSLSCICGHFYACIYTGVGHTNSESAQHVDPEKLSPIFLMQRDWTEGCLFVFYFVFYFWYRFSLIVKRNTENKINHIMQNKSSVINYLYKITSDMVELFV